MKQKFDTQIQQVVTKSLGVSIQDLTVKQDNMWVAFPNTQKAEQTNQKLFDMGVMSTSNPGHKKTVTSGKQIIFTQKDVELIGKTYELTQKPISFLQSRLKLPADAIRPIAIRPSGNINIFIGFESKEEAEKYSVFLLKSGIGSNRQPGTAKSVTPSNGLILTLNDCQKLEALMGQKTPQQKINPVGFFTPSPNEQFKRGESNTNGYTDEQMSIYLFADNCCDFPKLVVSLSDKGYDPRDASIAINELETQPKKEYMNIQDVMAVLDAKKMATPQNN